MPANGDERSTNVQNEWALGLNWAKLSIKICWDPLWALGVILTPIPQKIIFVEG